MSENTEENKEDVCHICGDPSDGECYQCWKLVCCECTPTVTQFNAGNPQPCNTCAGNNNEDLADEYFEEKKILDAKKAAKEEKNKKARKRYWLPENVKKKAD